jgi:hypothetical protein
MSTSRGESRDPNPAATPPSLLLLNMASHSSTIVWWSKFVFGGQKKPKKIYFLGFLLV